MKDTNLVGSSNAPYIIMSLQTVEKKEVYVKALFEYDAALDSGLPSKGLRFDFLVLNFLFNT